LFELSQSPFSIDAKSLATSRVLNGKKRSASRFFAFKRFGISIRNPQSAIGSFKSAFNAD